MKITKENLLKVIEELQIKYNSLEENELFDFSSVTFDIETKENDWFLPEKWCIKSNDNNISLLNYIIQNHIKNYNGWRSSWNASNGNSYFCYPQVEKGMWASRGSKRPEGYTEITTEQLKQIYKI